MPFYTHNWVQLPLQKKNFSHEHDLWNLLKSNTEISDNEIFNTEIYL